MNFEPEKMRQPYRFVAWLCGVSAPFGGTSPDRRLAFWPKKREVRPVFEKILSWQPERIILSRGRSDPNSPVKSLGVDRERMAVFGKLRRFPRRLQD